VLLAVVSYYRQGKLIVVPAPKWNTGIPHRRATRYRAAGRAHRPGAQSFDLGICRQRATVEFRPPMAIAAVDQQHVFLWQEVCEPVALDGAHGRILAEAVV